MRIDVELDGLAAERLGEAASACNMAEREVVAEVMAIFPRSADVLIPLTERCRAWAHLEDLRREVLQWKEARLEKESPP